MGRYNTMRSLEYLGAFVPLNVIPSGLGLIIHALLRGPSSLG